MHSLFPGFSVATVGTFCFILLTWSLLNLPQTIPILFSLLRKSRNNSKFPFSTISEYFSIILATYKNQLIILIPATSLLHLFLSFSTIPTPANEQILIQFSNFNSSSFAILISTKYFPSLTTFIFQILFCLVIEDFAHYWVHRLFHANPFLYKKFHKMHHEHVTTVSWSAAYAHPMEILLSNTLPVVLGPSIILFVCGQVHLLTIWSWILLALLVAVDAHSPHYLADAPAAAGEPVNVTTSYGIDLEKWIPFYAGPKHHSMHHKCFNGNYSSSLTYLDAIFGTSVISRRRE